MQIRGWWPEEEKEIKNNNVSMALSLKTMSQHKTEMILIISRNSHGLIYL
jgi:hypothetical protein